MATITWRAEGRGADPVLIQLAWHGIVGNAAEAMAGKARLRITSGIDSGYALQAANI